VCPFVRHALYTALYSSSESTDDIYYVYGMFAMLLACISVLVEAWAVKDRVYSSSPTIYPPSVRRALYTVLYSSSESTDDVCYVNKIIGKLLACIFALVGTWTVRNRLLAQCTQRRMRPSMCPSVCHALYTALYSSSESTDDVCYVYEMFAILLACISVLVEAWAVKDRVYSSSPIIYPPSVRRALYTA
jgi:hypothetical protein